MTKTATLAGVLLAVVILSVSPLTSRQAGPESPAKALVGGTLIDGLGATPLRNSVVLIKGTRIEAVGTVDSLPVPQQYQRISTEGMTVLPGLWELHAHLQYIGHSDYARWRRENSSQYEAVIMPATAEQLLMAGVTSARDLGGPPDALIAVRERIARGEIPGPTLYLAGPQLTAAPSVETQDYRWGVADARQAELTVGRLADKGINVIKVTDLNRMSPDTAASLVKTAHARGLRVAAHGRNLDEIHRGLEAGVDEFEHIDARAEYPPDLLAAIRTRTAAARLSWAPTVGTLLHAEYLREHPEMLDDPSWQRGLPAGVVADARTSFALFFRPPTAESKPRVPLNLGALQRKFMQLQDAGVELLMGADIGTAGEFHSEGTWLEIDTWVNHFGVEPMQALRHATYWPAVVMGVDSEYGTVSGGKYADVIAVRGDPLRHASVLRDPAVVIKHGRRYR